MNGEQQAPELSSTTAITPWMDWARSHIGEHELSGPNHNNPFIVALFKNTTFRAKSDETPWCAAFVCTALAETGYVSSRSAAAASYDDYGLPCDLVPGCIVTIEHADGSRHVTFCDHLVGDGSFAGLGGNQANQVKLSYYPILSIVATRWPIKAES